MSRTCLMCHLPRRIILGCHGQDSGEKMRLLLNPFTDIALEYGLVRNRKEWVEILVITRLQVSLELKEFSYKNTRLTIGPEQSHLRSLALRLKWADTVPTALSNLCQHCCGHCALNPWTALTGRDQRPVPRDPARRMD